MTLNVSPLTFGFIQVVSPAAVCFHCSGVLEVSRAVGLVDSLSLALSDGVCASDSDVAPLPIVLCIMFSVSLLNFPAVARPLRRSALSGRRFRALSSAENVGRPEVIVKYESALAVRE